MNVRSRLILGGVVSFVGLILVSIVALSIDMVLTSSLCIALSRLDGQGMSSAGRAARQALVGMALNPLPWAILSGSLLSASELALPVAANAWLNLLAQSASPVALFTLGCVLARTQKWTQAAPASREARPRDVGKIVAYKLLLHPALVWAVGQLLVLAGVPLDPFSAMVLMLVAALPSASNVALLSERFGADTGRIARIILLTTAAAFFTFSAAVALLQG